MNCHQCGVCCTEISISSPIHIHHPEGKPAGVKCAWLNKNNLCDLFKSIYRPKICSSFQADEMFCGTNKEEAKQKIIWLESVTS